MRRAIHSNGMGGRPLFGLHLIGGGDKFTGAWYPLLCMAFDLAAAIYILCLIKQEKQLAQA